MMAKMFMIIIGMQLMMLARLMSVNIAQRLVKMTATMLPMVVGMTLHIASYDVVWLRL